MADGCHRITTVEQARAAIAARRSEKPTHIERAAQQRADARARRTLGAARYEAGLRQTAERKRARRTASEAILDAQAVAAVVAIDLHAPDAIESINDISEKVRRRCLAMPTDLDPLWPLACAIGGDGEMGCELIGWLYGLSRQRIRQLEEAAVRRIRRPMSEVVDGR